MKKIFNLCFEIIFPLFIIPILCFFFLKTETIKQIIENKDKISLLVSIYSVISGFIVTTMAIFATSVSKALINISKNKKTFALTSCVFFTLLSMIFVLIASVAGFEPKIFKWLIVFSISMFFQYIFITLSIFYDTLNDLYSLEQEENDYKEWFKKELVEIKDLCKITYNKK